MDERPLVWYHRWSFDLLLEHVLKRVFYVNDELVLTVVVFSLMLGLSFTLALFSDTVGLLTLHLRMFYFVSAKMHHWMVCSIWSLFLLFRGKKWNVLKQRQDSEDFTLDQLLMGTVMFTILVFLFPTVFFYYLLFAIVPKTSLTF